MKYIHLLLSNLIGQNLQAMVQVGYITRIGLYGNTQPQGLRSSVYINPI